MFASGEMTLEFSVSADPETLCVVQSQTDYPEEANKSHDNVNIVDLHYLGLFFHRSGKN